jgi:hypothetical protein
MLKIYRELKNGDSDDTTTEDVKDKKSDVAVEEQPKPKKQTKQTKQSQSDIDPELEASNPETKTTKKGKKRSPASSGSKPKMYI